MSPFVVPVVFFVMAGLTLIFRGPLGQAIAHRIRQDGADDPRRREEVDALRLDVDDLRHQLAEAQERLDFTERLLARREEPGRIGPAEG